MKPGRFPHTLLNTEIEMIKHAAFRVADLGQECTAPLFDHMKLITKYKGRND